MKKKIPSYDAHGKKTEREIQYVPVRYIIAVLLTIIETLLVIGAVILCAKYIPYFYLAIWATEIGVVLMIIRSDDNPDYKVPWLLFVLIVPIAGFMIYFMYYRRTLSKKHVRRLSWYAKWNGERECATLEKLSGEAKSQATQICKTAGACVYEHTQTTYFESGEKTFESILADLQTAQKFVLLEFFIIEEGLFWNSILDILKEKAANGVEVKIVYDDIGCMQTLPGDYAKQLSKYKNIDCVPFARLRGQANNEFNNRSHRKILVIDGKIGYTGGVNIADEYINRKPRFGHWKDTAIRLQGEAVDELTRLFLCDYSMNAKREIVAPEQYLVGEKAESDGFVLPFGDGPEPVYHHRIGKSTIINLLYQAKNYVYITTPYLIVDYELFKAIENAALRGIDVRIVVPHIPDKKLVFYMTRSTCASLLSSGVKIYEYTPGFIHAKMYVADDELAMLGTINLDYRSLVHHFENGVWLYKTQTVLAMKADIEKVMAQSEQIQTPRVKHTVLHKLLQSFLRFFAPLL